MLWFIVIVAVLWTLVWLLFFRHSSPKVSTSPTKPKSSQSQSVNKTPQADLDQ
ncbi:MAG: hypothetical protein WDN27_01670 [Candidatus Saccharibacteria bacterium]